MNSKEEESSGIFSVYFPMGLMGQTWFISCLFFMKLRPQKWQVPVLLVTAPAPGPELWLSRTDEPEAVLLSVRPEFILVENWSHSKVREASQMVILGHFSLYLTQKGPGGASPCI